MDDKVTPRKKNKEKKRENSYYHFLASRLSNSSELIFLPIQSNLSDQRKAFDPRSLNPFTPMISLEILLAVYHTILVMLLGRIWY